MIIHLIQEVISGIPQKPKSFKSDSSAFIYYRERALKNFDITEESSFDNIMRFICEVNDNNEYSDYNLIWWEIEV